MVEIKDFPYSHRAQCISMLDEVKDLITDDVDLTIIIGEGDTLVTSTSHLVLEDLHSDLLSAIETTGRLDDEKE